MGDPPALRTALRITLTLAIGGAGGGLLALMGLPAAFLAGSMLATAAAAIARVDLSLPGGLRSLGFIVLGAVLGSEIDRATLSALPGWPVSLAALAVSVVVMMILVPLYYRRVHGLDSVTARLAAIPGALSFVLALSVDLEADTRRVAVIHSLRLAILMVLIPVSVDLSAASPPPAPAEEALIAPDMLILVLMLAGLGAPLGRLLGLPAPGFIGPMVISGGVFSSGLITGAVPEWVMAAAFVLVGTTTGLRFAGTDARFLLDSLRAGLGGSLIGIALTAVIAWPVAVGIGLPFVQVWLAMAPGGFETMTALAFAVGLDPAFVAGHQLLRFLGLMLVVPWLFRGARRRRRV